MTKAGDAIADSNCRACWLVRHLTLTYPHAYNIVSFDKLDYCSSLNNTRMLNNQRNFTFLQGDITNPSEVVGCLERHNIDTIFHFAAQSHVDLSFGNSYGFTHTNVYGTHVLLECAKKVGVRRFIHVSTDEVYGEVNDDDDDLLESSILAPTNPYAASKAAAEMLVHSYQKSFKLPVIVVRSNNVYGPHQYPESESNQPRKAMLKRETESKIRNHSQVHLSPEPSPTSGPAWRRLTDETLLVRWRRSRRL
jgi:dTDP-D-glucose 4,6-dehydratase